MAMVLRRFDPDYHAFYGNAFGEFTRNANEHGIYWGIKAKLNKRWTLAAYYDRFSSPWLAFQADSPREGYEYLARLTYKPSRKVSMYAQIRDENKERNQSDNITKTDYLVNTLRSNYIINLDFAPEKWIKFKSRVQGGSFNQQSPGSSPASLGYALIQDVNLAYKKFELSTRFALFDTDDFDSRQYAYERDVLYSFSIPAYFGEGTRTYVMLRYKHSKKLSIWLRWSQTHFSDRDEISSGLERINGPRRSDLRLQVMHKF